MLNLNNDYIDEKIKKCKELFQGNCEYKKILTDLDDKLKFLKEGQICEIKNTIYDLTRIESNLAYKLGVIDGIKEKNRCI